LRRFVGPLFVFGHGASQTRQLIADVRLSTFGSRDPMARRPGWIMADVLLMPTLEVGNPVRLLVLVKADDFSWLALKWSFSFHAATVRISTLTRIQS
jgi:hypothetical protein